MLKCFTACVPCCFTGYTMFSECYSTWFKFGFEAARRCLTIGGVTRMCEV